MLTPLRVVSLAALLIAVPAIGWAQTAQHSVDVFGSLGIVQLWSDESSIGPGVMGAGGAGYHLPARFAIEGLVAHHEHHRDFDSGVKFDWAVTRVTARLLRYFGPASAQTYVGVGAAHARVRVFNEFPDKCGIGPNGQFQCLGVLTDSHVAGEKVLSVIAGVRIASGRNLFVRPEFEMGAGDDYLALGTTVSLGWRW